MFGVKERHISGKHNTIQTLKRVDELTQETRENISVKHREWKGGG